LKSSTKPASSSASVSVFGASAAIAEAVRRRTIAKTRVGACLTDWFLEQEIDLPIV
jgi:hypothetical protein